MELTSCNYFTIEKNGFLFLCKSYQIVPIFFSICPNFFQFFLSSFPIFFSNFPKFSNLVSKCHQNFFRIFLTIFQNFSKKFWIFFYWIFNFFKQITWKIKLTDFTFKSVDASGLNSFVCLHFMTCDNSFSRVLKVMYKSEMRH